MNVGKTSYYYLRDLLGSIREMTNGAGAIIARYDYDLWGNRTKLAGTLDYVRRRPLGVERHFHKPTPIALIEEHYAAQVAGSMYPAAEFDFDASVGRSELAAQMRALCGGEAGCGGRGGQRRVVWVE